MSREGRHASAFKGIKDYPALILAVMLQKIISSSSCIIQKHQTLKRLFQEYLSVSWKLNCKAWVTRAFFQHSFISYLCPGVRRYYKDNGFKENALLIHDNPPIW